MLTMKQLKILSLGYALKKFELGTEVRPEVLITIL